MRWITSVIDILSKFEVIGRCGVDEKTTNTHAESIKDKR